VGYVLGVDLGTTFTAAAVLRDGSAQIASLGSRGSSIPSVVLLRDDETVLTGEAAERRAMTEPSRVAREFKRRLGDTTPILLAGTPYSADALMGRLLRSVVEEVSTREGEAPDAITVTHPANWGAYKIDLLNQAIRIADVGVPVTLITEPAAAAISYASQQRLEIGEVIAVFDLGGGTFDSAVLRRTDSGFEILGAPEGIERLGGIDFDAAVFAHVSRAIGDSLSELDEDDPATQNAVARLRSDCIEAKEALSSDTDTAIPVMLPNLQTEVRLTRVEFENMIRPSLVDAIGALHRALRSADISPESIAAVLLVGGSSRIPLVAQLVGAELGRPVAVDAHPKHAIAVGAAIAAGSEGVSAGAVAAAADSTAGGNNDVPLPQAAPPAANPPPDPASTRLTHDDAPAPVAGGDAEPPVTDDDSQPVLAGSAAPGSPGANDDKPTNTRLIAGAALVLVAIVVVAVVALAGGGDNEPPATAGDEPGSDIDTGDENGEDTVTTTSEEAATTTTTEEAATTTTTTIPVDEDCTNITTLERWVCLESVQIDGTDLVVTYTGEFGGEELAFSSGTHLHVFGNDIDPVNAGSNGPNPATWELFDTADEFRIALDSAILASDPDKICARVADARPERVGTAHGLYDPNDGNCLPIPEA